MYFSLSEGTQKAYLQWFPFSKLSEDDKILIASEDFYNKHVKTGGFVLFPEVMRHSENFIQKSDGSFRNSVLISPFLYLVLQSIGKEISNRYVQRRPHDIDVFYAGNYFSKRAKYKKDYDAFYKQINAYAEQYPYFIKTDISGFYGNINVNALMARINSMCNKTTRSFTQAQLLLIKELFLFCGDGYFPLIENSIASSYMSTVIYLDEVDCAIYEFIRNKAVSITDFRMIRYVDDLYILFSSTKSYDELTQTTNMIRNSYSSILKAHGLSLNVGKCMFKKSVDINEELKKSLYDEHVYGISHNIGELFEERMELFLSELYDHVCKNGISHSQYLSLIDKYFTAENIEFTASEVYNHLVYESKSVSKRPKASEYLAKIINKDISVLSIDPKRLSVMVMQSGNDHGIKALLNQLFTRYREGVWTSYDTTIAIAYLIQSKFQHIDLLEIIHEKCRNLYAYYYYGCKTSFVCQMKPEKWNRYLYCIKQDSKAAFLYFMSICEGNRYNYLGSYAYFKNFFDRISADMAHLSGDDGGKKKPNYNGYYHEKALIKLYEGIQDNNNIISNAHNLRNENPLSHSSSGLIDSDSTSEDLKNAKDELDYLIDQYSKNKGLIPI